MSKRLRSRPNKGRTLRPKSLQKARSADVGESAEQEQERLTFPEPAVASGRASEAIEEEVVPASDGETFAAPEETLKPTPQVDVARPKAPPVPAHSESSRPRMELPLEALVMAKLADQEAERQAASEPAAKVSEPKVETSEKTKATEKASDKTAKTKKGDNKAIAADAAPESVPPSKAPSSQKSSEVKSASAPSKAPPSSADLLESGISGEFFRNEQDSVPPFVDHADDLDLGTRPPTLSPGALARRARLRRIVAGVVTFAAVLSIGVLGKQLVAPHPSNAASLPVKQEMAAAAPEPLKVAEPVKAEPIAVVKPEASVAKVDEPAKADEKVADAGVAEEAKANDAKDAGAAAEGDKVAEADKPAETKPDPATAKELTRKAESLLNRGNRKEAIVVSQQAIEADPTDATPYLLLGSALQDSGKWKDGVEAYSECVRHATRGMINECHAMGGHK